MTLPYPQAPVGIGGWLILPIIGFIGTVVMTGMNLWPVISAFDGFVAIFKAVPPEPLAAIRLPTALSLAFGFVIVATAIWCLVLVFSKRRLLVPIVTAHLLILPVAAVVDFWADGEISKALPGVEPDPTLYRDVARGILSACIWIPYFHVSKRVKNTFRDTAGMKAVA